MIIVAVHTQVDNHAGADRYVVQIPSKGQSGFTIEQNTCPHCSGESVLQVLFFIAQRLFVLIRANGRVCNGLLLLPTSFRVMS
jgi:hypothetical protein